MSERHTPPGGHAPDADDLGRAVVLLNRYTVAVNRVVERTLGASATDNKRIDILMIVHRRRGITPSQLANLLGVSRSITARHITALVDEGLLVRHTSPLDGRSRQLALTRTGSRRVGRFARELADFFAEHAPLVKDAIDPWPFVSTDPPPREIFDIVSSMARAGRLFHEECTTRLAAMGLELSHPEICVVAFLDQIEEARPSRIAEEIHLSRQGTSDLLDRLEADAVVVRHRPREDDDGRVVHVRLTGRGRDAARLISEAMAVHGSALATALRPSTEWGAS